MQPVPPGNSTGNTWSKAAFVSSKAAAKMSCILLVDLVDDRQQVLAGRRQVGQLLGEELVPLLERRELLEGERVDPAELRELALGAREARLLLGADEGLVAASASSQDRVARPRLGLGTVPRRRSARERGSSTGTGTSGPYSATSTSSSSPSSSAARSSSVDRCSFFS